MSLQVERKNGSDNKITSACHMQSNVATDKVLEYKTNAIVPHKNKKPL